MRSPVFHHLGGTPALANTEREALTIQPIQKFMEFAVF
jgi:hypothetical protein